MNGQPGAHISEHAFGNALDIAAFVLADGHRITVKDGWQRLAGGAGLSARRAGLGLRPVHHRAGAGLEPVPLRSHPRRPDAARERPAHLPAGRGGRRGGGGARPQEPEVRVAADRAAADAALRPADRAGQTIRSPGAATPAAAIRPPPARSPRGGPGSRIRRPRTSTGSRIPGRGRPSTGATTATRAIDRRSAIGLRRPFCRVAFGRSIRPLSVGIGCNIVSIHPAALCSAPSQTPVAYRYSVN